MAACFRISKSRSNAKTFEFWAFSSHAPSLPRVPHKKTPRNTEIRLAVREIPASMELLGSAYGGIGRHATLRW